MFIFKVHASGGSGSRSTSSVSANTQNQTRGRAGGVTRVTRGRAGQSSSFNYNTNEVQYTKSGYPVRASYQKGRGYSYYMNGVVLRSSTKQSMNQVDNFFAQRDRNSVDSRFI